jgi:hypothetical protein
MLSPKLASYTLHQLETNDIARGPSELSVSINMLRLFQCFGPRCSVSCVGVSRQLGIVTWISHWIDLFDTARIVFSVCCTTKPVSISRIVPDKTETHVKSIPANVFSRELLRPIDTGFAVCCILTPPRCRRVCLVVCDTKESSQRAAVLGSY